MFYPVTLATVRAKIKEYYPDLKAKECDLSADHTRYRIAAHVLWMCDKIEAMPKSIPDAAKAGRWIGWILRTIETDLWFWDNRTSRDLIREDVKHGADIPHF